MSSTTTNTTTAGGGDKPAQPRLFVKTVDGEERVRQVYTASDETDALFEGFVEKKPTKKS